MSASELLKSCSPKYHSASDRRTVVFVDLVERCAADL